MDNKNAFKTVDNSLPAKLAIRQIALTCLEAMTGSEFSASYGKRQEVVEIVTYRKADEAWRFQITAPTDQQFSEARVAASFWLEGYKRGLTEAKSKAR